MPVRAILALIVCGSVLGCGNDPELPAKPQLRVDRDSIGFSQEFGSGTYIGAQPQESLILENGGLENLRISSVSIHGDKEFTLDGPLKTELKGKERTFLRVIFAPKAAKTYRAVIKIESNAENTPTKNVDVSGVGIKAPTDGG